MKKIIAISLASMSISAFGADNATTKPIHHWEIKTEVLTLNPKIPNQISQIDVGYEFGLQHNFNPNWYASVNTTRYDKDKWGYTGTLGLQGSDGFLRPYGELNYSRVPTQNGYTSLVGYDVGAHLYVLKYFVPFVEVDNFLQKGKESFQGGFSIPFNDSLSIGAAYVWQTQTGNNGANVKLSYSF